MHLRNITNFLSEVFVNFLPCMVARVGWLGKSPQGESNFCTDTLLNQEMSNCWFAEAVRHVLSIEKFGSLVTELVINNV